MNQNEFKYSVFAAGHGDHWDEILQMTMKAGRCLPIYIGDLRDAAYRYLCITMDYEKLYGFLVECDTLNRRYCVSWDESVKLICGIIQIWSN